MPGADYSGATLETDVLASLSRMARKGAYAVPTGAEAGHGRDYAVFSSRNGFARAFATIPAASVACAFRRGWLEGGQDGEHVRLTAAGTSAVRRARSRADAAPPSRKGEIRPNRPDRCPSAAAAGKREGPLEWLHRRKDRDGRPLISEAQFAAGERLCADYWRGQLLPRVTADWSGSATSKRTRRAGPGVGIEIGDGVIAARERVYRAVRAVGPELGGILIDVCCLEMGLQAAGREKAWPQRATRIVLDLALKSLARHYGLIAPEPSPGAIRLRHWGEEGYRPTLDAWANVEAATR
jgi:uncharacterized protein DUF6456